MSKEYSVKLSITLTNKDIAVLRQSLEGYILTIGFEANKKIAKDLLEFINNADETAKRKLARSG